MERQAVGVGSCLLKERPIEGMNGNAAGTEPELAVGELLGGQVVRQIAVFDHPGDAILFHDHTDPFGGIGLRDDLG